MSDRPRDHRALGEARPGAAARPGVSASSLPAVTLGGILLALFCAFVAVGAVLPVLPRYVRGPLAAGDLAVGIVITATAAAAVVARPIAGQLAERRGRRAIMVIGAALASAAGLAYFVATGVPALIAVRLALGVGEGFVFTAAALWIVSLAPADRRGQVVGLAGLSMWTGLTVGPLAGASLLRAGEYRTVWLFVALLPALGAALAAVLPDPRPPAPGRRGPLVPGAAVRPGVSLALGSVGYAALAAFVVLHLDARGIGNGAVAFTAYGAAYVLMRLFGGRLPDRFGPRRVTAYAGLAEAAGLLVLATAWNWPSAIAGAIVTGGGLSLLYPSLALMVIDGAAPEQQGAALGAYTSFWDVGLGLSGALTGFVASSAGYGGAFVTAAACAILAAIAARGAPGRDR